MKERWLTRLAQHLPQTDFQDVIETEKTGKVRQFAAEFSQNTYITLL